jgi:parallel beta-helix repeat protein
MPILTIVRSVVSPPILPQIETANWYVATAAGGGSDSNSGTDAAHPFLTINHALSVIGMGAGAGAGKIITVADGVYAEVLTNVICYGTNGNPFTLKSTNNKGAIIRPNATSSNLILQNNGGSMYNIVDGFVLDGVNVAANTIQNFRGTDDFTYQNNELKNTQVGDGTGPGSFQGAYQEGNRINWINNDVHDIANGATQHFNHAIYYEGSNGLIEKNTIHKVGGWGVQIFTTHGFNPSNNIVRKNRIYDFAQAGVASGILLASGGSNTAYDNLVYQTSANGNAEGVSCNGSGDSLYNNTVYNCGYQGVDASNSTNAIVKNNIASGSSIGINIDGSSGATVTFNDVFNSNSISQVGATGQTVNNNITSDPQLTNPAAQDFTIGSGSPAHDAGVTLGSVADDFIGTTRPKGAAYDIGAYEFME